MKYTLMQKNEPVMDVEMDTYSGNVRDVLSIHTPERLPLSVLYRPAEASLTDAFQEWIDYRNIPKTRAIVGSVFRNKDVRINSLSLKSLGLNLNDQYWFRPYDSQIHWEEVNFFQNDFSSHPLGMRFKNEITTWNEAEPPKNSPDYSSNGNLPKFWYIENNKRFLAKSGSNPYEQQVPNEQIACQILQQANLPHVTYRTHVFHGSPYAVCETFINEHTEYVPAYEILHVVPYKKEQGAYKHFLLCAKKLNIPHVKDVLDAMLQFDYLINNTDRHMGNFGFIRQVDTLEFKGMAPIFDNGNSLWFDSPLSKITSYHQPACPFAQKQDKQLKLTSYTKPWLEKVTDSFLQHTIQETLSPYEDIGKERIVRITQTVLALKENLNAFAAKEKNKN